MSPYDSWTRAQLIKRLEELTSGPPEPARVPKRDDAREFNVLLKPRRKIALEFCYHGWEYNGLTKQSEPTPLPTVEAVLEDALITTRLIDPASGLEGCGFSRCGRTDRGVSAAGQVVSMWVRSTVGGRIGPLESSHRFGLVDGEEEPPESEECGGGTTDNIDEPSTRLLPTDSELPYSRLLNRVLPHSIRILSWSPVDDTFDARFSCVQRHYKYFFQLSSRLSLSLMRDAASRMVGSHDFRNFCKVDGSKGIESYVRSVTEVSIDAVNADILSSANNEVLGNPLHVINVVGRGFLWHQIRHIAAILFHVGQGLEAPSIVSALLNADPKNPYPAYRDDEEPPVIVESKPKYEMAEALPLLLWDCGYKEEDLDWQADETGYAENFALSLNSAYTHTIVQATLLSYFERAALSGPTPRPPTGPMSTSRMMIDMGAGRVKTTSNYVPILKRERGDLPSVVNEKWRTGPGLRRQEKKRAKEEERAELIGD